jgi:hypothetical protein
MDTFLLSKDWATNPPIMSKIKVLISAAPDRILHDYCDLSRLGNLQVLWVLNFIPLPIVPAQ